MKSKVKRVNSLNRATKILMCLSADVHSIKEIAARCDYHPATVHRMLKTLEEADWVRQNPRNRQYYLGPLVSELTTNLVSPHKILVTSALHDLLYLSSVTGETINLGIMMDYRYVLLHEIPSKHGLKFTNSTLPYGNPTLGATGRVLLSQLSDQDIQQSLPSAPPQYDANKEIINNESLMSQIMKIRKTGYCVSQGEVTDGAICISAPIRNYIYPAALSIIGSEDRMSSNIDGISAELVTCTNRISSAIIA